MNVLFCIGFTKKIQNREDQLTGSVWNLLTLDENDTKLKVQTLFNFLSYLLSLEQAIEVPSELKDKSRLQVIKNKHGIIYDGVFFLNPFISRDAQKVQ